MSNSVIFILFCLAASPCFSQLEQTVRFEIPIRDNEDENHSVVSVGKQGLMVYRRLHGRKEDQIELVRIDTTLKEIWKGYIQVSSDLALLHTEPKEDFLFLLFKNRQYAQGDFQIVAVKIDKGEYGTYTVKNLIPFNPSEFVITNEAALIGGYFNYRPLILHYSFQTRQSKILPGFFNEPGELTQLKANRDGTVDVIVSARNFERRKSLWIRNYNPEGNLIKTIILQPDEDKNLIYGRSLKTVSGRQVVSGVYGRFPEYSRGIFVAEIDDVGEYKITYYNFADLERFFNYMKAKREKRVKERIERRKVKGKKIKFNYRFMVHELIPFGDQFVMLGEAFYPHYSYPNNRTVGSFTMPRFYSNPLMRGEMVFDGYQYTHAAVIGFDKNGKLKWDNSFEINDVRTFQLEQFVKLLKDDDRLVLLYLFDNTIRTKIIKNGDIVEGKTFDALKMQFSDDIIKPKDTEKSKLDYWYDDVFFASGIQQVKNVRESGVTLSRRVFFINKIIYK
jgi:hypothetical protein